MKSDSNLFLAALFDWALQVNPVPIDRDPELRLELFFNISGRDRTKSLPGLAGFECEFEFEFPDLAREILCFVEFTGFALGPLALQMVQTLQVGGSNFVGFA